MRPSAATATTDGHVCAARAPQELRAKTPSSGLGWRRNDMVITVVKRSCLHHTMLLLSQQSGSDPTALARRICDANQLRKIICLHGDVIKRAQSMAVW